MTAEIAVASAFIASALLTSTMTIGDNALLVAVVGEMRPRRRFFRFLGVGVHRGTGASPDVDGVNGRARAPNTGDGRYIVARRILPDEVAQLSAQLKGPLGTKVQLHPMLEEVEDLATVMRLWALLTPIGTPLAEVKMQLGKIELRFGIMSDGSHNCGTTIAIFGGEVSKILQFLATYWAAHPSLLPNGTTDDSPQFPPRTHLRMGDMCGPLIMEWWAAQDETSRHHWRPIMGWIFTACRGSLHLPDDFV